MVSFAFVTYALTVHTVCIENPHSAHQYKKEVTGLSDDYPKMQKLGFSDNEKHRLIEDRIEFSKSISRIKSEAREASKLSTCFHCKEKYSHFCNSHSVPRFCLENIAVEGKVYDLNHMIGMPLQKDALGIKEAGTFCIICNKCDGVIFQEYENPNAYDYDLSTRLLAQIAMKNYLQMISKRLVENPLHQITANKLGMHPLELDNKLHVNDLDLLDYKAGYNRARIASENEDKDYYKIIFHKTLSHRVPIAAQCAITLLCDFDDCLVNDIFYMSPDYHTEELHISIFPLEKTTDILLFVDRRTNRYNKFSHQLRKLTPEDQLAAINYIVALYSENVFYSRRIQNSYLENPAFIDVCKTTTAAAVKSITSNLFSPAINEHTLSKRILIPNFLSLDALKL